MIVGEPEVIERDGQQVLVDESGHELVCRKNTGQQSEGSRMYHRVDTSHYIEEGVVRPECGRIFNSDVEAWILRRRVTIESNWDGCSYQSCYGDYNPSDPKPKDHGHSGLAAQLDNMSVEEFDAAVGGER